MADAPRKAWIFANGEIADPERLRNLVKPGDCLVAADGGQRYLACLGLQPERVIGDLDSIDPGEARQLETRGVVLDKYPVDKDETDLELAIDWVLRQDYRVIRIAGALGGRLDQTLGNLFLLTRADLANLDVRLEDGSDEVFLVAGESVVDGQAGDTVSLVPVGTSARGVTTEGLRYPLHGEILYPEHTRGISNVMLENRARIRLEKGVLICLHHRN